MLVSKERVDEIVSYILDAPIRGYDTETFGVRFQDILFSFIVSIPGKEFYFNFNSSPDHLGKSAPKEFVLNQGEIFTKLNPAFLKGIWAAHNAQFDNQKIKLVNGTYPLHCHCTLITERLLRNDFLDYSLDVVAKRYGLEKDDTVDKYIKEHKLQTRVTIPGKKTVTHVPHYDLVPLEIMVNYACKDAFIHRRIAEVQRLAIGLQ